MAPASISQLPQTYRSHTAEVSREINRPSEVYWVINYIQVEPADPTLDRIRKLKCIIKRSFEYRDYVRLR